MSSEPAKQTYAGAGVDTVAADRLISRIASVAAGARRPEVLSDVGPFAGLFRLGKYRDPVLVASTDSVGTKVKLANVLDRFEGVGHDLVNHCVNDILTSGAEPLFFLDYIGNFGLSDDQKVGLVRGVAEACSAVNCALIGGETADMPGTYEDGDYDLVGFIVGIAERENVIDGSKIEEGDALALGPHLVRRRDPLAHAYFQMQRDREVHPAEAPDSILDHCKLRRTRGIADVDYRHRVVTD